MHVTHLLCTMITEVPVPCAMNPEVIGGVIPDLSLHINPAAKWQDARDDCVSQGGQLLMIKTQAQLDYFSPMLVLSLQAPTNRIKDLKYHFIYFLS